MNLQPVHHSLNLQDPSVSCAEYLALEMCRLIVYSVVGSTLIITTYPIITAFHSHAYYNYATSCVQYTQPSYTHPIPIYTPCLSTPHTYLHPIPIYKPAHPPSPYLHISPPISHPNPPDPNPIPLCPDRKTSPTKSRHNGALGRQSPGIKLVS